MYEKTVPLHHMEYCAKYEIIFVQQLQNLHNFMNNMPPLTFRIQNEINNKINFLDLTMERNVLLIN